MCVVASVKATPRRLIDLTNAGHVSLGKVRMLVLDEADRMLDMGFKPQLDEIIQSMGKQANTTQHALPRCLRSTCL
jgi:superfamily II DNA/RNA helicase